MVRSSLALIAIVALSAPVLSQCSTLTVAGSINAGETITVDVTGAPANALTVLAIGDAGTTSIPIPGSTLTLGVENFIVLPIGIADASGNASISVTIPAEIPAGVIQDHTFTVQAVSVGFGMPTPGQFPMLNFCVSNTATLVSGAG
jgi:hypothetical protein